MDFFDDLAKTYDECPRSIERARRSALAIKRWCTLDENTTIMMDFACGTGLASRELAADVKQIVGVDVSRGMVDQFNTRVFNQGIPAEEMQAICAELKGVPGELNDEKFDLIICTSAYHHFTDIDNVTRILTYFLRPGASLVVIDLQNPSDPDLKPIRDTPQDEHVDIHGHQGRSHEHHEHGHDHSEDMNKDTIAHVHHHNGLRKADIIGAFEKAGLDSLVFESAFIAKHAGRRVRLFIAKGTKG